MLQQNEHLREQTQRVLEYIRALDQHYGFEIGEEAPELARALSDSAAALDQILQRSRSPQPINVHCPAGLLRNRAG